MSGRPLRGTVGSGRHRPWAYTVMPGDVKVVGARTTMWGLKHFVLRYEERHDEGGILLGWFPVAASPVPRRALRRRERRAALRARHDSTLRC
ncbi:hypothetical protein PBI_KINGVEVEVE_92 [Mycobacterium phage KingVeVeVe]|uniref:Uncharacterized protein n=1 Tax=Mycobacterium phage KingVeVeVe TaxID=1471544 RepID=A0A023ZX64_9CAUD|nr:hypothetical protein PBI_KINGVEVEVE_92 [Mycobacterium phage KingVeVeVe]